VPLGRVLSDVVVGEGALAVGVDELTHQCVQSLRIDISEESGIGGGGHGGRGAGAGARATEEHLDGVDLGVDGHLDGGDGGLGLADAVEGSSEGVTHLSAAGDNAVIRINEGRVGGGGARVGLGIICRNAD
jgi:hypothetical protein